MNAQEKNALIDSAKATMSAAVGLVAAEVFSGLAQAGPMLGAAAGMIRSTGDEQDAVEAEHRASEAGAILAIPWPFIYVASSAWIAAVSQLRNSLPHYIDLEGAKAATDGQARRRALRLADATSKWKALSDGQRAALVEARISLEMLQSLGSD